MDETADPALGAAWRDEFPWQFLTRLCEIDDRLGGHPGERRAADLVANGLESAGIDPTIEPFEMQRWTRGHAELAVSAPADARNGLGADESTDRTFETVALPYSPAGDVHADLVDVGHGTPDEIDAADVGGKVALASTDSPSDERRVHRMEKLGHAAAAGAAAFVFHNHRPGQLPPTGALRFDHEAAIPGIGVSHETGTWLTEYADRGANASVTVEATTEQGESQNVVGHLGPDTDEEIVLLAHYDAHDVAEGALDNGCGIAVAVAAARILVDLDLDCGVRVAGVGCEELGLMGSAALAEAVDLDRMRAVVNVDGAGRHRDLHAITHTADAMADVAERVSDLTAHPISVSDRPHPYSDHWPFLHEGVSALQLHSHRAGETSRWERGWTHTRADTRDKADSRILREHAMLAALLVRELTAADPDRVDTDALRARLQEDGAEPGMRAAGVWPDGWE
ncbi:M28 family metallopeptidase [Halococcus saccharolyticus]|uniref:Carboxypeptidase Q n=1 Tax=Halococcus saccharolyticus DSM 5350 TaxID=1227455 RepID=M0MCS0_9EURY|nr:M28 family metallopeptidase [Halococcus saccharolyticus]EMA43143.1 peptidase M28 [Halococcus saccharolyticus DSM 5350]